MGVFPVISFKYERNDLVVHIEYIREMGLYVDLVVCQIGVKYSEIYCFMSCNRKKGVNSIDCKKSTS